MLADRRNEGWPGLPGTGEAMGEAEDRRGQKLVLRRLESMGIEAEFLPGRRSVVATLPLGGAPFTTLEGPRYFDRVRFATIGPNQIKCLEPLPFFYLPLVNIAGCTDAAQIEQEIRAGWSARTESLRKTRESLMRLGVEVESEQGGALLAFGIGVDDESARARCTRPGQVVAFQPETGETRLLDATPAAPAPRRHPRNLQADLYAGSYTVEGEERRFTYTPQVATDIVGLNKGPDGNIYGSTIISMHIFRFDRQRRELSDLGRVGFGQGEVYDVIAHRDTLYLGTYTGAYWAGYDPTQPWNPRPDVQGQDPTANPRLFAQLGSGMNRPFEYTVGPDERIYIACRADYGLSGGGLARFNPSDESIHVFRDEEQSIQAVTADDRYIYAGTSISGGRGCIEPTTQGKLVLFDPQTEQRVYTCIPDPGAIAVTSLAVSSSSGQLYGTTDTGLLFAFDREERQVVRTWQLRSLGTPLMGVPETYGIIHLTAASDGSIYGVTNRDLFKVDVSTDQIIYLDPPPIPDLYQIVEGAPGIFYMGARGHLLEYHAKGTPHYR